MQKGKKRYEKTKNFTGLFTNFRKKTPRKTGELLNKCVLRHNLRCLETLGWRGMSVQPNYISGLRT